MLLSVPCPACGTYIIVRFILPTQDGQTVGLCKCHVCASRDPSEPTTFALMGNDYDLWNALMADPYSPVLSEKKNG